MRWFSEGCVPCIEAMAEVALGHIGATYPVVVGQPGLDALVRAGRGLDVPRSDVADGATESSFVLVEEDFRCRGGPEEHEILTAPREIDAARTLSGTCPVDDTGESPP